MRTIERSGRTYHLPATEQELCDLVRRADDQGEELRIRGSAHSFPAQIWDEAGGRPGLNVLLDDYCAIEGYEQDDRGRTLVTVQAGCRLTHAPHSHGLGPGDLSRPWWKRPPPGLLEQLHDRGLALGDLGGISHQTVGGFVSTGSAGGSLTHGLEIARLRLIDARGQAREVSAADGELFHAAGTSMGLLGPISAVTFVCTDRYFLSGNEKVSSVAEADVDVFGDDASLPEADRRPDLRTFLEDTEYTRLLWWPQPNVQKLVVWQARRLTDRDFANDPDRYGTPDAFWRKPYVEIGVRYCKLFPLRPDTPFLGWFRRRFHRRISLMEQRFAGWVYTLLGTERPSWWQKPLVRLLRKHQERVIKAFTEDGTQLFWDTWWQGLPMDNNISDAHMPTWFTELWVPLEETGRLMSDLQDMYGHMTLEEMGSFCVEIYAGKPAPWWLHPSAGKETVRVDIFWFGKNQGDPVAFYQRFWDALRDRGYEYRPHWGKYAPRLEATDLDALYPQLGRFRQLCRERDPNGIFRTQYWRDRLQLDA